MSISIHISVYTCLYLSISLSIYVCISLYIYGYLLFYTYSYLFIQNKNNERRIDKIVAWIRLSIYIFVFISWDLDRSISIYTHLSSPRIRTTNGGSTRLSHGYAYLSISVYLYLGLTLTLTSMHACTHTHTYTHTHTHTHPGIHTSIPTYILTHIPSHTHPTPLRGSVFYVPTGRSDTSSGCRGNWFETGFRSRNWWQYIYTYIETYLHTHLHTLNSCSFWSAFLCRPQRHILGERRVSPIYMYMYMYVYIYIYTYIYIYI